MRLLSKGKNSRTNRATRIWPIQLLTLGQRTLSKKYIAYSLIGLLACLLSLPAMAQAFRGQVRGLVTDQTGSVLPGAKVTLSNVNTGVITTKPTDNAGIYVFDFVEPGTYTITVESGGFARHVQQNLVVQSSSELTVDAMLTPGALQQSVTVTAAPPLLETTSSNVELTIDTRMANDTPRLDRNPFKLTLIEPAAVNTRGEMAPYASWAANSVDLGGGTNLANQLLVDGNPIGIGHKAGYPPNQDDVQESVVSQNSVDASSGHSAGGLISLTTKSGTNDWHGMAFYLGRYPWLSAQSRPYARRPECTAPKHVRWHLRQSDHQEQVVQLLLHRRLEDQLAVQLLERRCRPRLNVGATSRKV